MTKIKGNRLYLFPFDRFFLENDIWIISELFSFLGRQIVEDVEDLKRDDVFCLC